MLVIFHPDDFIMPNKVVRLAREAEIADGRRERDALPIVVQLPILQAKRGKDFPTTATRTGVRTDAELHAYVKQPRIEKIRELLNINRAQLVNPLRHCSGSD